MGKGFTVSASSFQNAHPPSLRAGDLRPAQRKLLTAKVHVKLGAERHLSADAPFDTPWHGAIYLLSLLARLPDPLLTWWADHPAGHILLTGQEVGYVDGVLTQGERALRGVTQVPLSLLASDPVAGVAQALWPVDHLLGCAGEERGVWLSEGGGITPIWRETGQQINALYALGYGDSTAAQAVPRAYLVEGLAFALADQRKLNIRDPKLERLIGATFLNRGFCYRHLPDDLPALGHISP
jgi:hypothetical protein